VARLELTDRLLGDRTVGSIHRIDAQPLLHLADRGSDRLDRAGVVADELDLSV
jgi:hypothetical protein